jgi:pyruvate dehydrogenase E1 component alpha subunit
VTSELDDFSRRPARAWLEAYARMCTIRAFENQVQRLAAAGEVPGFPHLSTGQEAVAVGVSAHLTHGDTVYTGHRGHGHALALNCDVTATLAEIIGRDTGLCAGRGGSMHLVDAAHGLMGATGVVGGNLPLAAGAAWAAQSRGTDRIAVVYFGDGATGSGVFHETLNLAALWKLPVLFVCENNGYAEFTGREEHSVVQHVSAFAAPYGIPTRTIDGNDLPLVHAAAEAAINTVRSGSPFLLECLTHRLSGHYVGDSQQYRSAEELAAARAKCPIERLRQKLIAAGMADTELADIAQSAQQTVVAASDRARAAARPNPASVMEHIYSSADIAAALRCAS